MGPMGKLVYTLRPSVVCHCDWRHRRAVVSGQVRERRGDGRGATGEPPVQQRGRPCPTGRSVSCSLYIQHRPGLLLYSPQRILQ